MKRWTLMLLLTVRLAASGQSAVVRPSFEVFDVATVKPVESDERRGRMFKMEGEHRWTATNFTLKALLALAYDLNPKTISGGPAWMESQHFDLTAVTPGDVKPTRMEQMRMLRSLLMERFALKFHRVDKEFSIYALSVAKGGPKLTPAAHPEAAQELVGVVYPGKIEVPAKNVTMDDFVAMLQRATLDRPTVNKTGLTGAYDFTLDWAPDETQYGGELEKSPEDAGESPLFPAVQAQLGLKLTATRGMVSTMVVDAAQMPVAN